MAKNDQGPRNRYILYYLYFIDVPRSEKGEYLFRRIVMCLDLVEEDYFGLQFMDKNQVPHWLDKTKKLKKQIQIYLPTFHFRVKFYTSEPNNLVEELTRYQFFLQLKQDILGDKLPCPFEKAVKVNRFKVFLLPENSLRLKNESYCILLTTTLILRRCHKIPKVFFDVLPYFASFMVDK